MKNWQRRFSNFFLMYIDKYIACIINNEDILNQFYPFNHRSQL